MFRDGILGKVLAQETEKVQHLPAILNVMSLVMVTVLMMVTFLPQCCDVCA